MYRRVLSKLFGLHLGNSDKCQKYGFKFMNFAKTIYQKNAGLGNGFVTNLLIGFDKGSLLVRCQGAAAAGRQSGIQAQRSKSDAL